MNSSRAKEILMRHRPGVDDAAELELVAALDFLRQDEELRRWFEQHGAMQTAIRTRLRQIPVPEGLKEQIISERPLLTRPVTRRHLVILAALAGITLVAGLLVTWRAQREDISFPAFRNRMVSTALRSYYMDLETNDPKQIRIYLREHQANGDYVSPFGLEKATSTGCLVTSWRGRQVSMICFRSGQPLTPGQDSDLWFFVIDHEVVPDASPYNKPEIAMINGVTAASWTQDGITYLLAVKGDEALLRKFL